MADIEMTRIEIAERLRKLANEMEEVAVCLDCYGGLAEWSEHGREMAGAANIARGWADDLERQEEP